MELNTHQKAVQKKIGETICCQPLVNTVNTIFVRFMVGLGFNRGRSSGACAHAILRKSLRSEIKMRKTRRQHFPNRPARDIGEASDLWSRISNLMNWLRTKSLEVDKDWPHKYRENLHMFLGYWRWTRKDLRMSAKVLKRLNDG